MTKILKFKILLFLIYLFNFHNSPSEDPSITDEFAKDIMEKYIEYELQVGEGKLGNTAQFYSTYIRLIDNYFMFSRSIRTANFQLYKYSMEKMTHLFFAMNQQNYSR